MRLRNIESHFYPSTSLFACRPRRLRHRSGAKSARLRPWTLRFPRSSKTCEPQSTSCLTTHFYTLLRHTIASFARLIFCHPRYASSAVAILCYTAAAALSAVIWVPSLSPLPLQCDIFYSVYQLHVPLLACNSLATQALSRRASPDSRRDMWRLLGVFSAFTCCGCCLGMCASTPACYAPASFFSLVYPCSVSSVANMLNAASDYTSMSETDAPTIQLLVLHSNPSVTTAFPATTSTHSSHTGGI